MSLSKSKMLVFKQLFTFLKACCSIEKIEKFLFNHTLKQWDTLSTKINKDDRRYTKDLFGHKPRRKKKSQNSIKLFDKPHFKSFLLNLINARKTLRLIFTLDVGLTISLSDEISLEDYLSIQMNLYLLFWQNIQTFN
jgi:hypothetical protein